MLMYTSCGWFFDELSGIETVQVIKYAARALQLAERFGERLEGEFVGRLAAAKSNLRQWRDGATVYQRGVGRSIVTLPRVVAHYGISSLFDAAEDDGRVYSYTVQRQDARRETSGGHALAVGLVTVASQVTGETADAAYAVLHLGGHDVQCGVRLDATAEWYERMKGALVDAFLGHGTSASIRVLDDQFGRTPLRASPTCSWRHAGRFSGSSPRSGSAAMRACTSSCTRSRVRSSRSCGSPRSPCRPRS